MQAEFAAKPYEELIQLIRTGPPRMSPFGLKQLDEAANTVEFYIHAEDVRRAQPDWSQRDLDPVFADVLWSRTEKTARMMGRRSPVGLVLRRPDGQTAVAHKGAPVVTVTGEPGELLLFAAGGRTPPGWNWTATRTRWPACTPPNWGCEPGAPAPGPPPSRSGVAPCAGGRPAGAVTVALAGGRGPGAPPRPQQSQEESRRDRDQARGLQGEDVEVPLREERDGRAGERR